MSLNSLGLGIVLSARDLASGVLGRVQRAFTSLDDRVATGATRITDGFDGIRTRLGDMAKGAIASLGALAITNTAGDFEEQLAALGGIANATGAKLRRLETAALDAGLATQFSPTDAVRVLQEFASASFSADQSIRMLIPALDLAAGSFGKLSPTDAVGAARQALSAFGLEADQAALTMDKLLQAVNLLAFDASDLPLALSIAPRGAQAIQQSLDETLIAVGFAKAIITGTERASTAVSVAMERMADPQVQQKLAGIGVVVTDNQGRFRDFLDVILEMTPMLDRMSEKRKASFLLDTFGTEGLAGAQAMMAGIARGVEDANGQMVRGAAAVALLRTELANAAGTGERFRGLMLDTFAGQKKLLIGSLQTLAIVAGRTFTAVLQPVLAVAVDLVNHLIRAIQRIPQPLRKAIAAIGVAVAAVLAFATAMVALKAAFGLIVVGFNAFRSALAAIATALGPVSLAIGAAASLVAGFAIAYRKSLDSLAEWTSSALRRVRLAWDGIVQLFSAGAFSGAVLAEIDKAENSGIKRFVITVYMLGYRLQRLWEGIRTGFVSAIAIFQPVFDELAAAFADLGNQIFALIDDFTGAANGLPSSQFASFGEIVGAVLGAIVSAIAAVVGWTTRLVSGFLDGFRSVSECLGPAFQAVSDAFAELRDAFYELFGIEKSTGEATSEIGAIFRFVGEVIGKVFGIAITAITYLLAGLIDVLKLVVTAVTWVKDAFVWWVDTVGDACDAVLGFFVETMPNAIGGALDKVGSFFQGIYDFVSNIIDKIKEAIDKLIGWIKAAYESVKDFLTDIGDALGITEGSSFNLKAVVAQQEAAKRAALDPSEAPAAAEQAAMQQRFVEASAGIFARLLPLNVNLQVDGETIARASAKATEEAAERKFQPVQSF